MRQILQILGWSILVVMVSQILGMTSARADVDFQDKNGETRLIKAAADNQLEVVQQLLKSGAQVNLKDHEGNTALLYAVSMGSLEISRRLIQKGADLKIKYGPKGENILFECARHDLDKIADLVIKKDRSLILELNQDGETPLFEAARSGASHLASLLIRLGVDPKIKSRAGKTAVDLARENDFKETLKALKKSK